MCGKNMKTRKKHKQTNKQTNIQTNKNFAW